MSSSMDLNNNLIKNPRVIESLNDDSNKNNLTICKDSLIIDNLNQNPFSSVKALVKGHTVSPENLSSKPNIKKINATNEVPQNRGRSLNNKDLASIMNLTMKPNLAANDMYGNIDSNGNQLTNGNHITHDNWQTYGNSHTNGNHHTIGNSLNEETVLPHLTDIIKELPELSINLVSEVLSSLGDDGASGRIDTPLLDSKQVYQVLSNFNPEFLPFRFQYMDLFHSNAFSMPKRYLKNSITDIAGNTYQQDATDKTKINNSISPKPQNHLAEVDLPTSTSVQDSIIEANKQPVGPCKSVHNDVQGSNDNEKMTYLNVQRSNTASCAPKNVPCACPVPKISQSNLKTKEKSKVKRDETKPFKIGRVKSNRKNDTKTGLQKGAKISHGPKLGPHASHLGTSSSKSFSTPKPYKCEECSKTFTLPESLTRHLKIHVEKCLHVCNVCQKSFQTKNHLNNHVKTHRKHKSETCSKSFKTNKKLAKKQKTESACRNHKCDVCEKSFTCSSNLKRHSLIHTRAKHQSNEDSCKSLSQRGNAKKPAKVKLCCKFCLKQFQVEKRFQNHVQKCVKK